MRQHGVLEAHWSESGMLTHAVLAPVAPTPEEPERPLTPEQIKAAEQEAQRVIDRLTYGAS